MLIFFVVFPFFIHYFFANFFLDGLEIAAIIVSNLIIFVFYCIKSGNGRKITNKYLLIVSAFLGLITLQMCVNLFANTNVSLWYFKKVIKLNAYGLLGLLFLLLCDNRKKLKTVLFWVIGIIFCSTVIFGVYQLITGERIWGGEFFEEKDYTGISFRLCSLTQLDPNFTFIDIIALFFLLVFYRELFLKPDHTKQWSAKINSILLFLTFIAGLFTLSRTGLAMVSGGYLFYLFWWNKRTFSLVFLPSIALIAILYFFLVNASLSDDITKFIDLDRLSSSYNMEVRVEIWDSIFKDQDLNVLWGAFGKDIKVPVEKTRGLGTTAHSIYVEMLYDFGAIGMLLILGIWLLSLITLYRTYRVSTNLNDKKAAFSLIILIVCYLSFNSTVSDPQGFYVFFLMALSLRFNQLAKKPTL